MMKKMKPPYHYSLTPVPLSKGEGSDMLSG